MKRIFREEAIVSAFLGHLEEFKRNLSFIIIFKNPCDFMGREIMLLLM